jgi:hypothetical protein
MTHRAEVPVNDATTLYRFVVNLYRQDHREGTPGGGEQWLRKDKPIPLSALVNYIKELKYAADYTL